MFRLTTITASKIGLSAYRRKKIGLCRNSHLSTIPKSPFVRLLDGPTVDFSGNNEPIVELPEVIIGLRIRFSNEIKLHSFFSISILQK